MKKQITVLVKKNHPNIGNKGDIIELAAGYVFNYLIPNKIVEIPSKGKIKHIRMFNKIADTKQQNLLLKARNIRKKISNISKISIIKKIGDQKHIFGSVNEKEILNEIFKQTNQKIEKKDIQVIEIKNIGLFHVIIKFVDHEKQDLLLQVIPRNI